MKRARLIYLTIAVILAIAGKSQASVFLIDGKEVTKGQALIAKAKNEKVKVVKVDEMEISDKGTLKAVKTK